MHVVVVHRLWHELSCTQSQVWCRRRLLTAMGWTVVSVPYFDWNRLQSGLDKVPP